MKKRRKLLTQLYTPYILIIFLALVTIAIFATNSLKKYYFEQAVEDLEARAKIVSKIVPGAFSASDNKRTDAVCKEIGRTVNTRITMILPSGKVVCDSFADPEKMENHAKRPEIAAALTGKVGVSTHFSKELSQHMVYVAVPVLDAGITVGIVRTSMPLTHIKTALNAMYLRSMLGGLIVAIIAALLSLFVARKIVKPVDEVKNGAERYARGDFEYRLRVSGAEELSSLAETLNKMAIQLMRLEAMRRDFVANVSHELMTPITSIKGFVETLRDGAAKDPAKTKEFLKIIAKHTDRLGAIVEDLLSLSKIEQFAEKGEIKFEQRKINDVLNAAVSMCKLRAMERDVKVELICKDEDVQLKINAPLLEEAIVNLIDNAIKYSDPKNIVRVESGISEYGVYVKVADSGCGIPAEYLHRIFERFYRVDKARSGEKGGTGLGLSIVKHIVAAHGGHVHVESQTSKGSTFSIYLPIS